VDVGKICALVGKVCAATWGFSRALVGKICVRESPGRQGMRGRAPRDLHTLGLLEDRWSARYAWTGKGVHPHTVHRPSTVVRSSVSIERGLKSSVRVTPHQRAWLHGALRRCGRQDMRRSTRVAQSGRRPVGAGPGQRGSARYAWKVECDTVRLLAVCSASGRDGVATCVATTPCCARRRP
jgi:hypothetical protein